MLARHIAPGQSVLDLGMGTGALGRFLQSRSPQVLDGVTLSHQEAALAAPSYRHTWVADLDQVDLPSLTQATYDCIVCADVLEHLKHPERLLAQCRQLLRPGGFLLTSVPNAGYCGLLAELLQGDWRYRDEGLLDRTHLRFFTRRSLMRFFADQRWQTTHVHTTTRPLDQSEFRVAMDALPPSVTRYLLALPDALSYQFIQRLVPVEAVVEKDAGVTPFEAQAVYTAQLYLGLAGVFDERFKVVASATMGESNRVEFVVPVASGEPYSALRLDLADRPGFMRLQRLLVEDWQHSVLWQWQGGEDDLQLLSDCKSSQIIWSTPWGRADEAWLTLYGDDPWVVLPLPQELLQHLSEHGGRLTMQASWPMSADYVQAFHNMRALHAEHETERAALESRIEELSQSLSSGRREAGRMLEILREELQVSKAQLQLLSTAVEQKEERLRALTSEKGALVERLGRLQGQFDQLRVQLEQAHAYLRRIESFRVFQWARAVGRQYVKWRRWLHSRIAEQSTVLLPMPCAQDIRAKESPLTVDVIVPVYRGLEDTRRCIESVLAADVQTTWHLVVINDCSPEPEVTQWLREMARDEPRVQLLENVENLGFVRTVNRGMRLHPERDVLLLNSDTEVANDWLDRLQRAAYSVDRVGTVTPFSNHATICSYPRFCLANDLPAGWDTASLDSLCARYLEGRYVDVPTAVGFCMYIRRDCLAEVGVFDEEHFGKGYGEENDFCIRAAAAGWRHLHALDTFVRHAGGVSFGDVKTERELRAVETLDRLHPGYGAAVHAFVARDPARNARMVLDLARLAAGTRALVLMVSHNREGGTLRHVQELTRYLAAQAACLTLRPQPGGILLSLEGAEEDFKVTYRLPTDQDMLVRHLRLLQVSHIHYHHVLGHAPFVMELPVLLGVSHDFTAHDYFSYCPQISLTDKHDRYCGERGLDQCARCLVQTPAPDGSTIDAWRARHAPLLKTARHVLAPSHDAARRMRRFVPAASVAVAPHAHWQPQEMLEMPAPKVRAVQSDRALRIVVIGALSRIKGADLLENVAVLAARQRQPLEFHLLGYGYRHLQKPPAANLTVHGAYKDEDLPQLLEWVKPDLVWFPALWPETYSYTLSACLQAGLPLVVPDLGAFAERVAQRPWTWLQSWSQDAQVWLTFFAELRARHFVTGLPPPLAPAFALVPGDKGFDTHKYLDDMPQRKDLEPEVLMQLLRDLSDLREQASPHAAEVAGSRAVAALYWLRRQPLLARVARWIPTATQRRVKSWLLS